MKQWIDDYISLTQLIEEEGLDYAGNREIPCVVMEDKRLSKEAKLLYIFYATLEDYHVPFAPAHERIAQTLGYPIPEYEDAKHQLLMLGYLKENPQGYFVRVKHPTLDQQLMTGLGGIDWDGLKVS